MSDTQGDYLRLEELAAKLGLHEHPCLIYNTREEQLTAALPYLRAGLERGERCLYVADENTAATVLQALRKGGTDVDRHLRSGALTVGSRNSILPGMEHFDSDRVISFWIEAATRAEANGFSGLRVLSEVTWTFGEGGCPPGSSNTKVRSIIPSATTS